MHKGLFLPRPSQPCPQRTKKSIFKQQPRPYGLSCLWPSFLSHKLMAQLGMDGYHTGKGRTCTEVKCSE